MAGIVRHTSAKRLATRRRPRYFNSWTSVLKLPVNGPILAPASKTVIPRRQRPHSPEALKGKTWPQRQGVDLCRGSRCQQSSHSGPRIGEAIQVRHSAQRVGKTAANSGSTSCRLKCARGTESCKESPQC
jgi:hypothetical protein